MKATKLRLLLVISLLLLFLFETAKAQPATLLLQRFDTTSPPNVPANWTHQQVLGTGINWQTSTASPDSPPNAMFANEPPTINSTALVTPPFFVTSLAATLRFRNNYNLEAGTETGFDGMVLEISIAYGNWIDIVTAGGSFILGGYTHTISTNYGSPIAGRRAWSGNSAGYVTSTVRLPPSAFQQVVELRWRIATDSAIGGSGVRIDDVHVVNGRFSLPHFDFDGDSKTDLGTFRPALGEWWINRSSNGLTFAAQFGSSTDKLTPSDFTGDGKTDIAFWRPSTGFWFVLRSEDFSFYSFPFGASGDIPAPADFDGDTRADPAVFRPSTATWFISNSTGGTGIFTFGSSQDKPIPADYDGDGKADIAIYRPNTAEWWLQQSGAGLIAVQFGANGDKVLPGDFTRDGRADVAFWRPSTGFWFVLRSQDYSFYSFPFGTGTDIPVQGDYDGDGETDAAVFRPSAATWFLNRSSAGTSIVSFGAPTDSPVPAAFVR